MEINCRRRESETLGGEERRGVLSRVRRWWVFGLRRNGLSSSTKNRLVIGVIVNSTYLTSIQLVEVGRFSILMKKLAIFIRFGLKHFKNTKSTYTKQILYIVECDEGVINVGRYINSNDLRATPSRIVLFIFWIS